MAKKIEIEAACHIDIPGHLAKVRDGAFWEFAAQTWYQLYQPYVPFDTGTMMESVTIAPGRIHHNQPYAAYQYIGNYQHRKEKHPKASRKWDVAAIPTQKPKLIRSMQKYVDNGKLR